MVRSTISLTGKENSPTLGNLKIILAIIANDNLIHDAHNKVHSENNLSVQEQTNRDII